MAQGLALDLVIIDDETSAVVGEVGISNVDPARKAALIGYWLLPDGRGRGLATHAVAELSTWLFEDLGLRLLVARCAVANAASQHVAARAGYEFRRVDDDGYQLWARLASV